VGRARNDYSGKIKIVEKDFSYFPLATDRLAVNSRRQADYAWSCLAFVVVALDRGLSSERPARGMALIRAVSLAVLADALAINCARWRSCLASDELRLGVPPSRPWRFGGRRATSACTTPFSAENTTEIWTYARLSAICDGPRNGLALAS
jgi:hypothetical protein